MIYKQDILAVASIVMSGLTQDIVASSEDLSLLWNKVDIEASCLQKKASAANISLVLRFLNEDDAKKHKILKIWERNGVKTPKWLVDHKHARNMISDEEIRYCAASSDDNVSNMACIKKGFEMFKLYYTDVSFAQKYFSSIKTVACNVVTICDCGNLFMIYVLAAMQSHHENKWIQKYGWQIISSLKQSNKVEAPLSLLLITLNRTLRVFRNSYSIIQNALWPISFSLEGEAKLSTSFANITERTCEKLSYSLVVTLEFLMDADTNHAKWDPIAGDVFKILCLFFKTRDMAYYSSSGFRQLILVFSRFAQKKYAGDMMHFVTLALYELLESIDNKLEETHMSLMKSEDIGAIIDSLLCQWNVVKIMYQTGEERFSFQTNSHMITIMHKFCKHTDIFENREDIVNKCVEMTCHLIQTKLNDDDFGEYEREYATAMSCFLQTSVRSEGALVHTTILRKGLVNLIMTLLPRCDRIQDRNDDELSSGLKEFTSCWIKVLCDLCELDAMFIHSLTGLGALTELIKLVSVDSNLLSAQLQLDSFKLILILLPIFKENCPDECNIVLSNDLRKCIRQRTAPEQKLCPRILLKICKDIRDVLDA